MLANEVRPWERVPANQRTEKWMWAWQEADNIAPITASRERKIMMMMMMMMMIIIMKNTIIIIIIIMIIITIIIINK